MIGEVGLGSNEMLGMKSKDSPSKVISIPGSHRRQRTYSEQTCQQLELSLDLNASSPSGATLYDSPDLVPHPLASPSTPRITAADASMRNGGFFYDLPAHYEQSNDLSRYPDMEKSLGQMQADSLDLGWGLERGCGGDDSTTVTMFGDVEMNKSKALISEEVMVDNGKGPTLAALNADATDSSVFEDIECIIMTDCMLSSATSVPQSFSGKAEPPVVVTANTEDTKPTWHTLDLSKCEDTKPAWPTNLLNAGKPNLQALLMASLAQHPKTPPVDNILQKTPILARQLSNASSATPTVDQGSSSPAVTATSPTLQFSGNIVGGQVLNVIPNVTLLGPLQIVSQPTTLTCTLQQSPQNNMDVTTVVSAAPPPLMSPLSSTPISTLPPVVPKKPVVVTAAAAAGKPATSATSQKPATVVSGKPAKIEEKVSGLREIIGKKRSISPGSEGSIERKWEEIMEFINNEEHDDVDGTPQPEKKIKLEPQDVAFNPTDQLDEDEDEYDSDGAGSDRENDDMSDAESVTSHSSFVEDFIASGRKEKRYFWQYNMQSKGPKGKRLCKTVEAADPHILNDFEDPVFDPELNEMRYKHNGKARRGDGNDITPSPHKLFSLGTELNQLNKKITCMTPVSELPVPARTTSRREKNKYASRACRLKKKAQHEANKLKLHGLQREHHQLMLVLGSIKHAILSHLDRPDMKREHSFHDSLDGLIKQNLRSMIAGHTAEYVNSVLERVAGGDSSGGIYNSDEVNQESAGTSKVGAVNCDSWA